MMKLDFNAPLVGIIGKYRIITVKNDFELKYVKNMETGAIYCFNVYDLIQREIKRIEGDQ